VDVVGVAKRGYLTKSERPLRYIPEKHDIKRNSLPLFYQL